MLTLDLPSESSIGEMRNLPVEEAAKVPILLPAVSPPVPRDAKMDLTEIPIPAPDVAPPESITSVPRPPPRPYARRVRAKIENPISEQIREIIPVKNDEVRQGRQDFSGKIPVWAERCSGNRLHFPMTLLS